MSDAEKLTALEVEVSGLRSLLGETGVFRQNVARDIDMVKTLVVEQQLAHGRDVCAFEKEMRRVREAVAGIEKSLAKQEGEWRVTIGDLDKRAKQERSEVSGLKEVLGNLQDKYEKLRETVVSLGGSVQQLEEENRRLGESSEGLKSQLAQVESGQQCAVARLEEAIAAGGPKVKDDLGNVQRDVARLKEEMIVTRRMTEKEFPLSTKKGKAKEKRVEIDVPDGIIAGLTRTYRGNVQDRKVVEVTSSGTWNDKDPDYAAKNAANLESDSYFASPLRKKEVDIPHTRNNWLCYDFKERRIVPVHYAIRTHGDRPGGDHLKSWLVETSLDGENWQEVAREENNNQLNGPNFADTFPVPSGGGCRFIRLVNVGRNHQGSDCLQISAWEIFGSLFE
jgi:hypothetical protein